MSLIDDGLRAEIEPLLPAAAPIATTPLEDARPRRVDGHRVRSAHRDPEAIDRSRACVDSSKQRRS
ncbi:hypothetical protein [Sorangium sp. So ce394]|uniref:hypothetical protein n=1 Tax=Sorangium sp. So ce394 TaxID=3133310 RepID=UPI003F5B780A